MAKSEVGSIVTIGLIGGAGYIAGAYMGYWAMPSWLSGLISIAPVPTPVITSGTASGTTGSTGSTQQQTQQTPPANTGSNTTTPNYTSIVALADTLRAKSGQSGMLTFDGWNYYYQKLFGTYLQATDPSFDTRTGTIMAEQFLAAAGWKPSGISGLGGLVWPGGYVHKRSILQRAPRPMGAGYVPKRRSMGVINRANWRPVGT
jgi:hypothetical protein